MSRTLAIALASILVGCQVRTQMRSDLDWGSGYGWDALAQQKVVAKRLGTDPHNILPMVVDEFRRAGLDVSISVREPELPVKDLVFLDVEYRGAFRGGWEFLYGLRISFEDRESGAVVAECLYSANEGAQNGFVLNVDKARKVVLKFIDSLKSGRPLNAR